jgi:hypothetical protein
MSRLFTSITAADIHRASVRSGIALHLCSGGSLFESEIEHRISWLRIFVHSSVPPGKCWDSTCIITRSLPSKFFLVHQSSHHSTLTVWDMNSAVKLTTTHHCRHPWMLFRSGHFLGNETVFCWSLLCYIAISNENKHNRIPKFTFGSKRNNTETRVSEFILPSSWAGK